MQQFKTGCFYQNNNNSDDKTACMRLLIFIPTKLVGIILEYVIINVNKSWKLCIKSEVKRMDRY
jgi:hypothetical protein